MRIKILISFYLWYVRHDTKQGGRVPNEPPTERNQIAQQCKCTYAIACFLRGGSVVEYQAFMVAGAGKSWLRIPKTRETHRAMGKEWGRKQELVSLQNVVCKG